MRGPVEKAERKLLLHTFQQACVQQTICPAFFFCVKSSAYCLVIDWAIHKGLLGSACSWTAIKLPSVAITKPSRGLNEYVMSRMGHARILFWVFMGACYGGREKLKVKCRMIVTQGRNAERAQMRAPRSTS